MKDRWQFAVETNRKGKSLFQGLIYEDIYIYIYPEHHINRFLSETNYDTLTIRESSRHTHYRDLLFNPYCLKAWTSTTALNARAGSQLYWILLFISLHITGPYLSSDQDVTICTRISGKFLESLQYSTSSLVTNYLLTLRLSGMVFQYLTTQCSQTIASQYAWYQRFGRLLPLFRMVATSFVIGSLKL